MANQNQKKNEPVKVERHRGPNKPHPAQTAIVPVMTGEIMLSGEGREAPKESQMLMKSEQIVMPIMNSAQMKIILGKTPAYAIKRRPGRGGKTFKYVTYGYVVAMLNRAFGFDWDFQIKPGGNGEYFKLTEIIEDLWDNKEKKFVPRTTRNISVYGELTVRIRNAKNVIIATITKPGVGSQNWEATVEFGDACKGAKSDALKVAAHELGIGLDLYWDDQSELSDWENEQLEAQKAASALVAASNNIEAAPEVQSTQFIDNNKVPETPMELLVKSMTVFQLDGVNLGIKLGCSVPELMSWNKEKVAKGWEKLQKELGNAEKSK